MLNVFKGLNKSADNLCPTLGNASTLWGEGSEAVKDMEF